MSLGEGESLGVRGRVSDAGVDLGTGGRVSDLTESDPQPVFIVIETTYDVHEILSDLLDTQWSTLTKVNFEGGLLWSILNAVVKNPDFNWNVLPGVLVQVGLNKEFNWNTSVLANRLLDMGWNGEQLVTRDNKFLWDSVVLFDMWEARLPDKTVQNKIVTSSIPRIRSNTKRYALVDKTQNL